MRRIVFTDLDGTLLDHKTYSWDAARPALDRLRQNGVPWMFVTSKTRAEVEILRRRLNNEHPFVVENGGAAFVPAGYFPFPIPGADERDGYQVVEWGAPYAKLTEALRSAAGETGCRVQSFASMSLEQTAAACGLPPAEAELARRREYDEPFSVLDPGCEPILIAALLQRGFHVTRGGRFHHVCRNNDKAIAVQALRAWFEQWHGPVSAIGLGDGWNDLPFLETVDTPVIIRSSSSAGMHRRLPRALLTDEEGPSGWNTAILHLL